MVINVSITDQEELGELPVEQNAYACQIYVELELKALITFEIPVALCS